MAVGPLGEAVARRGGEALGGSEMLEEPEAEKVGRAGLRVAAAEKVGALGLAVPPPLLGVGAPKEAVAPMTVATAGRPGGREDVSREP